MQYISLYCTESSAYCTELRSHVHQNYFCFETKKVWQPSCRLAVLSNRKMSKMRQQVSISISEDNDGDFRKKCKRVRLENGAETLLTSAFIY